MAKNMVEHRTSVSTMMNNTNQ